MTEENQEPVTAEEHFHRGTHYWTQGYRDQAIEHFQTAALLDAGGHATINYNLAVAYAAAGQTDAALDQLRYVIPNRPEGSAVRANALNLYFEIREGTFNGGTSIQEDLAGL